MTVHVRLLEPGNAHHAIEGSFKALGPRPRPGRGAEPPRVRSAVDEGKPVTPVVAVLDYEMSNLRSACKALEHVGAQVRVVTAPDGVAGADAVVLPGVGHFRRGDAPHPRDGPRRGDPRRGRRGPARPRHLPRRQQLLFEESEESPGASASACCRAPCAGWRPTASCPTSAGAGSAGSRAACWRPWTRTTPRPRTTSCTHFGCEPEDPSLVLGRADHGVEFCAAAGRKDVMGVQFHPEKSSRRRPRPARALARGRRRRAARWRPSRDHPLSRDRPAGRTGRAPAPG